MKQQITLTNSEIEQRIKENIHNQLYRRIMYLRLVDGLTYERIAEYVEMSPRHVIRIVKSCMESIVSDNTVFTEIGFS